MNETIRSLLDEAVADVRPRCSDPAPAVMRRGRKARIQHLARAGAAGAAALALIATGAIVAGSRTATHVAPAGPAQIRDYVPPQIDARVIDGVVWTGGLTVPIPNGWLTLRERKLDYCQIPPNSVLINVMELPGGRCDLHPQLSLASWEPMTYQADFSSLGTVSEVILPGGQPLWFDPNEVENAEAFQKYDFTGVALTMPWAKARFAVDAPKAQVGAILDGIRADPVIPARLTLPSAFSAVQLNRKGEEQIASTDKAAMAQVVALLRGLDQPVQDGELPCPGAKNLTSTWKLAGTDMAGFNFIESRATGKSVDSPFVTGMVAISTSDSCAFATSSLGGRVHLPDDTLQQVTKILRGGR